jgi:hypothetical protein
MRRMFLVAATIFSLGCGTCLAQVAAVPNTTTTPSSTQAPTFPALANLLRPPGAAANTLGTIQPNLGSPIGGSGLGAIQICPASGMAGSTANIPVDATDATTNAPAGFGTSTMSGSCNAGSPASSPRVISGPEFVDGSVPLSATEGGGLGLSPLIAGPISIAPSAACPSSPTPFDSAGAMGTPSVSAC